MRTTTNIRYIAEPQHVREVTLTGTTDLEFWTDYLKAEGLAPVRCGDDGQIVIVAAEMVYLGLRFTEVSFSVRAVLTQSSGSEGMRLLHAFTSSRVFAWCERTIFATPYGHGEGHVSVHGPPSVRLDVLGSTPVTAGLGVFNGLDPTGTWTLFIADVEGGSIGETDELGPHDYARSHGPRAGAVRVVHRSRSAGMGGLPAEADELMVRTSSGIPAALAWVGSCSVSGALALTRTRTWLFSSASLWARLLAMMTLRTLAERR